MKLEELKDLCTVYDDVRKSVGQCSKTYDDGGRRVSIPIARVRRWQRMIGAIIDTVCVCDCECASIDDEPEPVASSDG